MGSNFGREDMRETGHQTSRLATAPLSWPPKPRALLIWFFGIPGYLFPWNVAYAIAAIGIWFFLTPSLDYFQTISVFCFGMLRYATLFWR